MEGEQPKTKDRGGAASIHSFKYSSELNGLTSKERLKVHNVIADANQGKAAVILVNWPYCS